MAERETVPAARPAGAAALADDVVLEVKGLKTHFFLDEGVVRAVDGVDLAVERGKMLCIVGESGCGKSITARSILQIVSAPGRGSSVVSAMGVAAMPSTLSSATSVAGSRPTIQVFVPLSVNGPGFCARRPRIGWCGMGIRVTA